MQVQNGSVHAYSYDLSGRPTAELVTMPASGIECSVMQIGGTDEIHGRVQLVTSYGGGGNVATLLDRHHRRRDDDDAADVGLVQSTRQLLSFPKMVA